MIQFTNSPTPEIITELQTLLNQLEKVSDDLLESVQKKLKIDLTKNSPFENKFNCEFSPFLDFIQHLALNTKTQKFELLDFVEIRDGLVDDELVYFGKTTKEFRNELCSTIRKLLLKLVSHNISITPKSFDRRSFFSHLLKLIDNNYPEVLAFKTNKSDIQLKTLFHKNFLKRQLEQFDFLNSKPLEVQSLIVTEKKTLLDFIDFLNRHSFSENDYVFGSLETLGKVFGDDLNSEVFWVPLLQQLKGDEEKLVREGKLLESNITYKEKVNSFITVCERIARRDYNDSFISSPYFKLLGEGVRKLRFII